MTDLTLDVLQSALEPIIARLERLEIQGTAIALLGPLMLDLRKDMRSIDDKLMGLRADIQDMNDRSRHNVKESSIKVLNEDIIALRDDNREIKARLAVLEQQRKSL
jgi:cob(I)alamin adenosyltransferase